MAYSEDSEGKNISEEMYTPTAEEQNIVREVYGHLDDMITKRNAPYPEFNDRTLAQIIDDSDKRLNAYTFPRDAYDPPKEEWQSNIALPTIKDRQMKILAGFALQPPDIDMKTYLQNKIPDVNRAEISKWLVTGSYMSKSNPTLESFWEGWESSRAGTVIKYEGYMRATMPQKFIKSYDIETGKIEYDERDVTVEDDCFSYLMPLTELYISSFYQPDIQKQDRLAWVRNVSAEQAEQEFGRNPKWKFVKTKKQLAGLSNADVDTFYFKSRWDSRVEENEYEIVRMYCKLKDSYQILINGVLMLDAPLVWRFNGKKIYPFAKSIFAPFTTEKFFYGQPLADHMAGLYDQYNTLWNTMSDNQYRRMVRALLVGRVNADALNLEDEYITNSTKITVEDVTQVVPMPVAGLENADVTMLKMISQSMDEAAPSMPSILGNKKATAREVVIANDRQNELKSLYAEMIVDLWVQKYRIRLANIQQNYPQKRKVYDKKTGEVTEQARTYIIEGATLDRVKNEVGTLAVVFDDIPKAKQAELAKEIAAEEKQMQEQGLKYKKIVVPTDYLDNTENQVTVVSASVWKQSLGYKQATVLEKIDTLQKVFPQYFLALSDTLVGEVAAAYGDNPAQYEQAIQNFQKRMAEAQKAQQNKKGQGGAEGAAGGAETPPEAAGGAGAPPGGPTPPPGGGGAPLQPPAGGA